MKDGKLISRIASPRSWGCAWIPWVPPLQAAAGPCRRDGRRNGDVPAPLTKRGGGASPSPGPPPPPASVPRV